MSGTIKKTTGNYNLRIPYFDKTGWGREMERNFDIVDAVLFAVSNLSNIVGVWQNSIEYDQAQRVVDDVTNTLWQATADHVSAASGTFAEARAASPGLWSQVSQTFNNVGQWTASTNYVINDIMVQGYQWAIAINNFTSTTSLADDILAGNLVEIIDFTTVVGEVDQAVLDALAAQSAAELAEANAELAETNAETAETNAELAEANALLHASDAEDARDSAQIAQGAAELAESNAETAETNALLAQVGAETAQGLSEGARDLAQAAQLAAELAETNAETAETNAELAQVGAEAAETRVENIVTALETMSGFRNKIINGDFDVWQRAVSQTSSGYGSDDRWNNAHAGSTKTHSQQTFVPGQNDVPGNPTHFSRTVVSSVVGTNNYVLKTQRIQSVKTFAGEKATLTFYAKADAARDISIEFYQGFGTGGSPSAMVDGISPTKISLTTSWQRFDIVVNIPSIAGKTLGSDGNDLLGFNIWFEAGTSWNARTVSLGHQSGTFDIAHVSFVEGDATAEDDPFSPRHIGQELALCQWYTRSIVFADSISGYARGTGRGIFAMSFSEMRVPPTGIVDPDAYQILYRGLGTPSTSVSVINTTTRSCLLDINVAGTPLNFGEGLIAQILSGHDVILDAEI